MQRSFWIVCDFSREQFHPRTSISSIHLYSTLILYYLLIAGENLDIHWKALASFLAESERGEVQLSGAQEGPYVSEGSKIIEYTDAPNGTCTSKWIITGQ